MDATVGRVSSAPPCNSDINPNLRDNAHETEEAKEADIDIKSQATTAIDEYWEI